ncbi:alpha/beta fold hydrolase [Nocardia callitridis]|uniref:Alpha/beta hydrolase n=1 Tax=Nocardia callitridis TaxID=648753 RepID=A0ABP9KNI5_9NOCA
MAITRPSNTFREVQRADGTAIRYTVSGPPNGATTLVLIHGWACDRTYFDAVTDLLSPDYRVIAVDLAEHGESRSPRTEWTIREFAMDVAAALTSESAHDVVAVGHSMGGAVAVELARLHPDTVSRVVALDALHYLFLFPALDDVAAAAVIAPFHEDFPAAVRAMVAAGSPPDTDPALQDGYFDKMVTVRQPGGVLSLEALVHWDMEAALREVTQPVTVFAVRAMLTQEAIDRYGDRMRITPIDLGSHHFPVESPGATAGLLTDLLSRPWPHPPEHPS